MFNYAPRWDTVVMTDPTKYRRIADYHIERLIHKYNPADQKIVQEYTHMLSNQQGTEATWAIVYDNYNGNWLRECRINKWNYRYIVLKSNLPLRSSDRYFSMHPAVHCLQQIPVHGQ